ncbi:DUF2752 domain-containing protein [Streptomyces sp. NPDC006261]|uniref:DUF2752 domain-containing protein n=1 Tax=Streptomyces sp. NPDC006261 TaxID=3156739 RepID=UPI0033B8222A
MDTTPTPATEPPDPEAEPQGAGPWSMPLTVCPTPDVARPTPPPPAPEGAPGAVGPHQARTGWAGATRRLATPLGILAAVAGAFAYVGTVDPNEPGHYPVCPLLKLTGAFCPGCGGLRSAHAFVHGDLGAAFSANAVATTGYFLFAVVWVLWLVRAWRGQPLRIVLAPVWWWGIGALLLIFTIVRNLPFGSALAP